MHTINSVELKNFKCFQKQKINFRPLTLLTGINSSGKSTVIQSLLLLRQILVDNLKKNELQTYGELVNLGLPSDVLNINAEDDTLSIAMRRNDEFFNIEATLQNGTLYTKKFPKKPDNFDNFLYLNANRISPNTLFPVPTKIQSYYNAIGNHGEFAAYILHKLGHQKISNTTNRTNLFASAAGNSATIQMQTEAWLSLLGTPVRLQTERSAGTDAVILRFSFPDISNTYYRPTNVGFGLTYALPIFVAALYAPESTLLIVENPEAHLHPKGQALMGQFLARAATSGIQVIIETHSDHVLNGIRVAVKKKLISHTDVQINFFHQINGISNISTPYIDSDGHIDQWPDNFFDEWNKQLLELL